APCRIRNRSDNESQGPDPIRSDRSSIPSFSRETCPMRHPQQWLVLGVSLLAGSTALGAPRERDVWQVYTAADGTRYGSVHTQVVRLPDGNYRMTRESRTFDRAIPAREASRSRYTARGRD